MLWGIMQFLQCFYLTLTAIAYMQLISILYFRHVQINNEGAIHFYERHGFEIVEEKKNYYKRIEPADAYVLQKTFKLDISSKSKEEKKDSQWQSIK